MSLRLNSRRAVAVLRTRLGVSNDLSLFFCSLVRRRFAITMGSFRRVRGQDIGNKHGQDIGNRRHTKNASVALRRRTAGWFRRRYLKDCLRSALLGSMRTFHMFGLEKGQSMALIHFLLPLPVSDKHSSPHQKCYLCLDHVQESRPTKIGRQPAPFTSHFSPSVLVGAAASLANSISLVRSSRSGVTEIHPFSTAHRSVPSSASRTGTTVNQ